MISAVERLEIRYLAAAAAGAAASVVEMISVVEGLGIERREAQLLLLNVQLESLLERGAAADVAAAVLGPE